MNAASERFLYHLITDHNQYRTLTIHQGQIELLIGQRRVQIDAVEARPQGLVDAAAHDLPPPLVPVADEVLVGPVQPLVEQQLRILVAQDRILGPEGLDAADLEVGEHGFAGAAQRADLLGGEEVRSRIPGQVDHGDVLRRPDEFVEPPVGVALQLIDPPSVDGDRRARRDRRDRRQRRRRTGRRSRPRRASGAQARRRHRHDDGGDAASHRAAVPAEAIVVPAEAAAVVPAEAAQIVCTESDRSYSGRQPRTRAASPTSASIQSTLADRAEPAPSSWISPVYAAA